MSTFSSDDVFEDPFSEEEGVYDDPYEVVMYDIDDEAANDVYALLNMLTDDDRSWYAKRRLNVLASSGPLSALVAADIIVDSLGRKWNPLLHPRDRFGRFIETGGFFRWFMKGEWAKGQVVRIDSDGVIHARSKGNDGIPDGTPIKFNSKQANKLISTASDKASLSGDMPDFDAEIPGFPEASPAQRRVYNALQFGDMPGEDLYIYRDPDMGSTDFGNEMADLVTRDLIQIDKGDKPRARRMDQDELGVLDIGDDEIGDVPDDETPDLDDSPQLTKAQRDLYDQLVEMDRGEGDGIGRDEVAGIDNEDLAALVEAGVLTEDGNKFDLVNPEGIDEVDAVDEPVAEIDETDEPEVDVVDEIERVAEERFPKNVEQQEAFIQRAGELAGIAEPEEGAEYDRDEKRARDRADAWWENYNAPEPDADTPVEEVPESAESVPAVKRRNEYRAEAQDILNQYEWPEDYLDSPEGEKYIQGVTDLLYAADLDAAGETDRAALNRQLAENKLRDIGISEDDIAGWAPAIDEFRAAQGDVDVPEAEEIDVPEADVPEDMPEADLPEDLPESDIPEPEVAEVAEFVPNDDLNAEDAAQMREAGFTDDELIAIQRFNAQKREREAAAEPSLLSEQDAIDDAVGDDIGPATAERLRDINVDDLGQWVSWSEQVRARREPGGDLNDELISEKKIADEMGLDLFSKGGIMSWTTFTRDTDMEGGLAEQLYQKHNGDVGMAALDFYANRNEYEVNGVDGPSAPESEDRLSDFVDPVPEANEVVDEGIDIPEDFDTGTPEPEAVAVDMAVPESALVPSADEPAFQRILDQPDFLDNKPDISENGEVLDRAGNPVELGAWYKANRGGEGDPDQVVGFADQEKYPGWVFIQTPNGKMKMVLANNPDKRLAGLNRMPDPGTEARERIRVQRAVGGSDILNLDQNNPKNRLFSGEFAEVGMRVGGRGNKGLFQEGDEGIIVGFGWNAKTNTPIAHVVKANDPTKTKLALTPNNLVMGDVTPPPPTPEAPAVPDVDPNVPDAPAAPDLPNGAEDEFEGALLDQLDSIGDRGAPRGELIDIDEEDAGEKIAALRNLVDRGVIEEFEDPDRGRKVYRRAAQEPERIEGAENDLEESLLNAIDNLDRPARRGDLMDLEDDDIDARMDALRALIDRGVLRQEIDPDTGKPVFRRRGGSGSAPTPMSDEEAVAALRSGVDPILIANSRLNQILADAGFNRIKNGEAQAAGAISPNDWVIAPQAAPFPIKLKNHGMEANRVYMAKRSSGRLRNDVMNEVMAGAISADLDEALGRDTAGLLYHPRVGIAEAPRGLGERAGGAVIMDHAIYAYSPDHQLHSGRDLMDQDLKNGNATKSVLGLAMYDFLINNTEDRHGNNQMYVEDPSGEIRAIVIDNGYAFGAGAGGDFDFKKYANMWRPNSLINRADRSDRAVVTEAVEEFVSTYQQLDVESVMNRIRSVYPAITPEQEQYAREWIETAKSRVDKMALDTGAIVDTLMSV